jgi:hypothetical protein
MAAHKRARDYAASLEQQLKQVKPERGEWQWQATPGCMGSSSQPVCPALAVRASGCSVGACDNSSLPRPSTTSRPALSLPTPLACPCAAAVDPFPLLMGAARQASRQQQHQQQAAAAAAHVQAVQSTPAGAPPFTLCSHCGCVRAGADRSPRDGHSSTVTCAASQCNSHRWHRPTTAGPPGTSG